MMSSVTISAAQLGRSYRSAARRASAHPASIVVLDRLRIRTEIQLGGQPCKLDDLDLRSVSIPSRLASQLDALAGPQMAPLQVTRSPLPSAEPARFRVRSSSRR